MAKTALSGADLSLIRGYQSIKGLELYVTPLVEVASGTITAISNRYPSVSLTVTWTGGDESEVVVGQYYKIFDGDTLISNGIIRRNVSGNTCYIVETPLGSFGFAANIEAPIEAGMSIVIYSHHAMMSLNSRIANKIFYKYWDLAYSTQNESNLPVANAGAWQARALQAGNTSERFTLPKSGENISFALGIDEDEFLAEAEYLWELPTGVSLVSGYGLDDSVIEVDAEPGTYLIELTVTIFGDPATAYLWLFVSDDNNPSLDKTLGIQIESDSQGLMGREISCLATGENIQDYIYVGAGMLLQCYSDYAGESLSTDTEIDSFIGYVTDLEFSHDGNIGTARFKIVSPMVLAQQIGQVNQSLTQVTNPTNWNQMSSFNANVRFFSYYLIRWTCPALMDMHDLDIAYSYEGTKRKYLEVNSKNLQANLVTVANYMLSNIGSSSDGATVMRLRPQYLSNADRNDVPNIWTILASDIKAPINYIKRLYNAFSDVRGGAFLFSSGKPKAAYAGRRWSQGSGTGELSSFIVTPSEGETRIKEVLGHYMAEQNAAIQGISVDLTMNQDVLDPAYMAWYTLTIPARYDPNGTGINARLFATEISREWEFDSSGIKKRIRLTGQLESFGQSGEILPIGNAQGISAGGWSIGYPQFWSPNLSTGMFGGNQASFVLVLNHNGNMAISFDYTNPSPTWSSFNTVLDNVQISDFDFDYNSAFFANGRNAQEALGLYMVTVTAATASIWYFPDILRSLAASVIQSYTLNDSSVNTEARIKCSETLPTLILSAFKDGTGTLYGRSTDGGASWSSLTRAGSAISDISDNDNLPIGLAVFGNNQFLTAPDSGGDYGVYRATGSGSFSILSSSALSRQPIPMIIEAIENDNYLFVTQLEGGYYSNDFDGSDYFDFEGEFGVDPPISAPGFQFTSGVGANWAADGIVAGGDPGDCFQFQASSLSASASQLVLIFDFSNIVGGKCINATFDIKFLSPNSSRSLRIQNVSASVGDFVTLTGQDEWHSVNLATMLEDWTGNETSFQPHFVIVGETTTPAYIWIDNVVLFIGDGYNLWRVESATGSSSWVAIDPAVNKAPARPYGLTVNLLDSERLDFVSQLGADWYSSEDSGDNWTTEDATSLYRTFYTVGDNMLAGGINVLDISFDQGNSFSSILGNLSNLWNGIGTIKRLLAL